MLKGIVTLIVFVACVLALAAITLPDTSLFNAIWNIGA